MRGQLGEISISLLDQPFYRSQRSILGVRPRIPFNLRKYPLEKLPIHFSVSALCHLNPA